MYVFVYLGLVWRMGWANCRGRPVGGGLPGARLPRHKTQTPATPLLAEVPETPHVRREFEPLLWQCGSVALCPQMARAAGEGGATANNFTYPSMVGNAHGSMTLPHSFAPE